MSCLQPTVLNLKMKILMILLLCIASSIQAAHKVPKMKVAKKNKRGSVFGDMCLRKVAVQHRPERQQNIDGTGNNQRNPLWGKADTLFRRIASADYADGANSAAGQDRPSARLLSNIFCGDAESRPTSRRGLSAMVEKTYDMMEETIELTCLL